MQRIAQAASAYERQRAGRLPQAVNVVMVDDTLVITLRGALSQAEMALADSPEEFAQVQEFHRQLFASTSAALRTEIERITGVDVRDAAAEVVSPSGTVAHVSMNGAMVQVFLLAQSVPFGTWSGTTPKEGP
jgi:uncharacterized protein YbcI